MIQDNSTDKYSNTIKIFLNIYTQYSILLFEMETFISTISKLMEQNEEKRLQQLQSSKYVTMIVMSCLKYI